MAASKQHARFANRSLVLMSEEQESEFAYSVRQQTYRSGTTVWRWVVRHRGTGNVLDAGTSLRSHDAAETAAQDAIFFATQKRRSLH
jgi:hypothetical protein